MFAYTEPSNSSPMVARYEGGENDQRLLAVWQFVACITTHERTFKQLRRKIARLFDYKGELIVATRSALTKDEERLFRLAWWEVGNEAYENVQFHEVYSSDWECYWNSRRFESDWRP
jgi:hypothetical protein